MNGAHRRSERSPARLADGYEPLPQDDGPVVGQEGLKLGERETNNRCVALGEEGRHLDVTPRERLGSRSFDASDDVCHRQDDVTRSADAQDGCARNVEARLAARLLGETQRALRRVFVRAQH